MNDIKCDNDVDMDVTTNQFTFSPTFACATSGTMPDAVDQLFQRAKQCAEKNDTKNMIEYYTLAAGKGHTKSMFHLACHYDKQKDNANAIKYYKMGSEHVDTHSMFNLAMTYEELNDRHNMIKYYLMAIKRGDICSMLNLGIYYDEQKDYSSMVRYFSMAAEKGDLNALRCLGTYYVDVCWGIRKYVCNDNCQDDVNASQCVATAAEKARHCLITAAERGDDASLYQLGRYYDRVQDTTNMIKYFTMSADKGDVAAMYRVGRYYKDKQDYNNMIKYFSMAVDNGHVMSMLFMARHYKNQMQDVPNMIKYFMMASQKGNSDAMFELGYYYSELPATEENVANAVRYYSMASERGHVNATYNLGLHYSEQKDYVNMTRCYRAAAERGDVESMIHLALYYKQAGEYERARDNGGSNSVREQSAILLQGASSFEKSSGFLSDSDRNFDLSLKYHLMAATRHPDWMPKLIKFARDTKRTKACWQGLMKYAESLDETALLHVAEREQIIKTCAELSRSDQNLACESMTELFTLRQRCKMMDMEITQRDQYIAELEVMPEGPKYSQAKTSFRATVQSMSGT